MLGITSTILNWFSSFIYLINIDLNHKIYGRLTLRDKYKYMQIESM